MDAMSLAYKSNIVPTQEYLLQGSVMDSALDIVLHRLRGLCDYSESGPETFHDHELVFAIKGASTPPNQPVFFRVRKAMDHADVPWHLRYLGQAEATGDKSRHTLLRSCIDVGCSDSVVQFLNEIGFRLDHEFIARGYMFRKGRMKVTVSKLFKLMQPGVTENLEPVSASYLVELSVVAPAGQDQIQDDIKNFAEQLKPLVLLEKLDHRRLQMT